MKSDKENIQQWLFNNLIIATENGERETVKMFLEAGAPVDRRQEKYPERTALHIASFQGHLSTAEYLFKKAKADVNIADGDKNTALHLAAMREHTNIVHLICDHGANIDGKGKYGFTALHWASRNGHLPIVQCLVGRGASLNQQNDGGETPLYKASQYGHVSIVALLLENGADAAIKNKRGDTARDVAGRAWSME